MAFKDPSKKLSVSEIDAQIEDIISKLRHDLGSHIQTIEETLNQQEAVGDWYRKNFFNLIQKSLISQQPLQFPETSALPKLPKGSLDRSAIEEIRQQFSELMKRQPDIGVFDYFSRKNIKLGYLDLLTTVGDTLTHCAIEETVSQQSILDDTERKFQQATERLADPYKQMLDCSRANNFDGFLGAMKSIVSHPLLGDYAVPLIMKPFGDQASPLEVMFHSLNGNTLKEAEFVGKLLDVFPNDHARMRFLSQSETHIQNEDTRKRWNVYTDAFVGVFLPAAPQNYINAMAFARAAYQHGMLEFQDTRGNGPSFGMEEATAEAILKTLARRPTHMSINKDQVVNAMGFARAAYQHGMLEFQDTRGNGPRFVMEEDAAQDILDALAKRPTHMRIADNQVVNAMGFARAAYQHGMLEFQDTRGNGPSFVMEENAAQDILDALANRPTHVRIADNQVVNVMGYARAGYEHGKLLFEDTRGNGPSFVMEDAAAKDILNSLANRPTHVRIADNQVVNVMGYARAAYEYGKLEFEDTGRNGPSWPMDELAAHDILDTIAKRPTHVRIADNQVINAMGFARAVYHDGRLDFEDTRRNGPSFVMDEAAAQEILDTLAKRPTHMRIADNQVINAMGFARVVYHYGRLDFEDTRRNGPSLPIDEAHGEDVLKSYHRLGQKLNVMQIGALNPTNLALGIRQGAVWEITSRTSTNDTSILNMLPLIIMGTAILLEASSERAPAATCLPQDAVPCDPQTLGTPVDPSPSTSFDFDSNCTNYLGIAPDAFSQTMTDPSVVSDMSAITGSFADAVSNVCGGSDGGAGGGGLSGLSDPGFSAPTPDMSSYSSPADMSSMSNFSP